MAELFLVFANLFTCMAGVVLCVCRMGKMTKTVKAAIRYQYNLMLPVLFASGFSWIYGEPATLVQWAMSAAMTVPLLIGISPWRNGPPQYAIKA